MTPQEINQAIAEDRGYTDVRIEDCKHVDYDARSVSEWQELRGTLNGKRARVPNYHADLNACHEMEKGLTDDEHFQFRDSLWNVCKSNHRNFMSATAPQRCEAYIEVKGLRRDRT